MSTDNELPYSAYDQFAIEYDQWFDRHPNLFHSEVLALKKVVTENKFGIEIGVGSGRFAQQLNIRYGVEPSESMAKLALDRGINIIRSDAEHLTIEDQSFDFAAMITAVCFLNDIPKAFAEVHRILKNKGELVIGLIDRNSKLGKKYEQQKNDNKFYKDAHFHSTEAITQLLADAGFSNFSYWQTLFHIDENQIEQPQPGYGKGSFVVIKAEKSQ